MAESISAWVVDEDTEELYGAAVGFNAPQKILQSLAMTKGFVHAHRKVTPPGNMSQIMPDKTIFDSTR